MIDGRASDVGEHLGERGIARDAIDLHRARDDARHLGRHVGVGDLHVRRIFGAESHEQLRHARRLEGHAPDQGLEEHRAHRPNVGARIDAFSARLLGRHVVRRADHRAFAGSREGVVAELGEPEVDELGNDRAAALAREEDVARLDVAMDDAELMRRLERLHHRHQNRQRLVAAQTPLRLAIETFAQIAPVEQLLHQIERTVFRIAPHVEDADHVGVLDARRRACLAEHARDVELVLPPTFLRWLAEELEGHPPLRPLVLGLVHRAHAAIGDPADHSVFAADEATDAYLGVGGHATADGVTAGAEALAILRPSVNAWLVDRSSSSQK